MKQRIEFARAIRNQPELVKTLYKEVEEEDTNYLGKREKTPEQKAILMQWLADAKEKLYQLGISKVKNILPDVKDISLNPFFLDAETQKYPSGASAGTRMALGIPKSYKMEQTQCKFVFLHELAHFITKQMYTGKKPSGENALHPVIMGSGFDRTIKRDTTMEDMGIYEEALCELFALYSIDEAEEYPIAYPVQTAFIMSLIDEFAVKNSITSFEGFKTLFKGHISRDFSFQKKLVDTFGTEAVRNINNISTNQPSPTQIAEIAHKCGFRDKYVELLRAFEKRVPVTFDQIKARFILKDDLYADAVEEAEEIENIHQAIEAVKNI